MQYAALRALFRKRPWVPIEVELSNGTVSVVNHPEAIVIRADYVAWVDRKRNDIIYTSAADIAAARRSSPRHGNGERGA